MVGRSFVSLFVGLWFSALYLRDLYGDRMVRAKVDTKLPLSSDDTDDVSDETHRHTPNSVHLWYFPHIGVAVRYRWDWGQNCTRKSGPVDWWWWRFRYYIWWRRVLWTRRWYLWPSRRPNTSWSLDCVCVVHENTIGPHNTRVLIDWLSTYTHYLHTHAKRLWYILQGWWRGCQQRPTQIDFSSRPEIRTGFYFLKKRMPTSHYAHVFIV